MKNRTIHAATEYVKKGKVHHRDICPPNCDNSDLESALGTWHQALDNWADKGKGSGFFIIKELGYPVVEKPIDLSAQYQGISDSELLLIARMWVLVDNQIRNSDLEGEALRDAHSEHDNSYAQIIKHAAKFCDRTAQEFTEKFEAYCKALGN